MESVDGSDTDGLEVVLHFLQEDQWTYQRIENKPVVRAGFRGDHGTWICYFRVEQEQRWIFIHSLCGLNILPQFRLPVLEYLDRINQIHPNGRFEMEKENGDVRFKTSFDFGQEGLKVSIVRSLAYENVQTMNHYFPGLVSIVYGGQSPEMALARIEKLPA